MAEDKSQNELTTALHLTVREVSDSSLNQLAEKIASLTDEDREVIAQIVQLKSENALLFIIRGAGKGSRFQITSEGVTIGRAGDSSVFLDDVTVSRSHAKIAKVGRSFVLRDEGSLNGTYMNNNSVTEHTLVSGDEFQIGKFHLLFINTI